MQPIGVKIGITDIGIGVAYMAWGFDISGGRKQDGNSVCLGLYLWDEGKYKAMFAAGSDIIWLRISPASRPSRPFLYADIVSVNDGPSNGVSAFMGLGVGYPF